MALNSSAEELREHAEIFQRWADETEFPEMREAFLSLAAGIADRLLCSEQSRPGMIHSASRSPRKASTLRDRLTSIILKADPWQREDYSNPIARLHPEREAWWARKGDGKTISDYRKDQIVFSQGDAGDAAFYIQKGAMTLRVTLSPR
jgi:hypothetical protein